MKKLKLVWQDEFNYSGKPDPSKWSYDVGARKWRNPILHRRSKRRSQRRSDDPSRQN